MAAPFTVTRPNPGVTLVDVELGAVGSERWFLLRSDVHHDNAHCNREMEMRHLREAQERDAGVIDNGDLFCAMQGKWDRRADQTQLRDEHRGNDYLDALVRTTADDYGPYAEQFVTLGHGNHETGVILRHQSDLTERLCATLNDRHGTTLRCDGYYSWVVFRVRAWTQSTSYRLFRHHGSGGGGPVTRGVIDTNRMSVYLPDAHVVLTGHTHDEWIVPVRRLRLSQKETQYHDEILHVRVPGYKQTWDAPGASDWDVMHHARGPKPTGAAWLRFYVPECRKFDYDVTRAK